MKLKYFYRILTATIIAAIVIACNDTLDEIGFTQQPERDRVTVGVDTIELDARTVLVESVFAQTRFPVLGEYIDPIFGSIKSEYIGGFFLPNNAKFTEGANIDSVRVMVSYTTMIGDSLAPMRLSVFRVNKSLADLDGSTNIDPTKFADMSAPLGEQIFTGRNRTFRTEVIQSGTGWETIRIFDIPVMLPTQIGEDFLAEYLKPGHGKLANTDVFNEWFPGLYFTTTFGNSTIINVNITSLSVHYSYLDEGGSSAQRDTIRTNALQLHITPEVTQVNTVQTNSSQLLAPSEEHTFIKSPAGVNTELTFPISQVHEKLRSQALNLADFTVFAMPDVMEMATVQLNPPNYLLLINKDSLDGFFERRRLPDSRTSFLSNRFDTQTFSYRFGNISSMFNHYLQELEEDEDLTYYLIPVDVAFTTTGGNMWSPGTQVVTGIYNQMWPTAAILDKRRGSMRVSMIFSDF
ncbi:MAG: DUF4270 domain-containing protein [Dysgonamonadaceae bacterium]|jgi:hypothetical protein|nr:DUF4270 domain-containing protein [Dysgonamonadaceae bacterium]